MWDKNLISQTEGGTGRAQIKRSFQHASDATQEMRGFAQAYARNARF